MRIDPLLHCRGACLFAAILCVCLIFPANAHAEKPTVDDVAPLHAFDQFGRYVPELEALAPVDVEAPNSKRRDVGVASPVQEGPPLRAPDSEWIESTLASMTLDEKIGQMIMPGYTNNTDSSDLIDTWHVGGFIFQGNHNTAPAVLAETNYLQGVTSVPLIFSTDCEAGLGARFTDATRFPMNMGSGAAYDLDLMRQQGRITARECRAIGIQIGFGPVVDVNTEPVNPIIGIRSFGDNPTSVSALAHAYIEGANAEGLLCTFKHFPGHGAAAGDSHLGLPTINISLSELQEKHVSPYAELLGEGVGDLVMTAHVWYPALDPGFTPWPATLSTAALTGILRNQLNYGGCVISDSFAMGGLQQAASTYDGVKLGVQAGLDIILTPPSVEDAFNGIKDSVTVTHEIPESRIDDAVRRILALKSRVGMPESTTVPVSGLSTVAHPDNIAVAEEIGKKTIAAHLDTDVVPVMPNQSLGVFVLGGNSTIFYSYSSDSFTNAMSVAHSNTQVIYVPSNPDYSDRAALISQARNFDKVLIVSMEWGPGIKHENQVTLVKDMVSDGISLAYLSFGSPYQWNQFPDLQNFLCGFSCHYATQREMAKVIVGESTATAHWPVRLNQVISAVSNWALY